MAIPSFLRPLWHGWMRFSHAVGLVMSTIILTILWIVGFGIYAIILRIVRIPKIFQKPAASYWIDVSPDPKEHMRYPF